MNLDIKKLIDLIKPIKKQVDEYKLWLISLVAVSLFGFVIYRINYFNGLSPSESAVDEKIKTLQRPRIDKSVVDKLEKLEHDNIQVQSLFNQARENPFTE